MEETARFGDAAVRQALRQALIEAPASLVAPLGLKPPAALEALLAPTAEDAKVLETAQELQDLLLPRVRAQIGGSGGDGGAATTGEANGAAAAAAAATVGEAVNALFTDAAARDDASRQLIGAQMLSRRLGASLLRRAAVGAERAAPELPTAVPAAAREALASAPTRLADAIEPPAPSGDA